MEGDQCQQYAFWFSTFFKLLREALFFRFEHERLLGQFERIICLFHHGISGERSRSWFGNAHASRSHGIVSGRGFDKSTHDSRLPNVLQGRHYHRRLYSCRLCSHLCGDHRHKVEVSSFYFAQFKKTLLIYVKTLHIVHFSRREYVCFGFFGNRRRSTAAKSPNGHVPNGHCGTERRIELAEIQTLLPRLIENTDSDTKVRRFWFLSIALLIATKLGFFFRVAMDLLVLEDIQLQEPISLYRRHRMDSSMVFWLCTRFRSRM